MFSWLIMDALKGICVKLKQVVMIENCSIQNAAVSCSGGIVILL